MEAGHTRAMVELIRHLPKGAIEELHLVYFEGASSLELFPEFHGKIIHHKVPFKAIFPFLFKAIFFQVWCFILINLVLPPGIKKIGIGTACLDIDFCNVQFVQSQWEPYYFKDKSFLSIKTMYKKILFFYFKLCENYLFRKEGLKILALSDFVNSYLVNKFNISSKNIKTIYSSVNLKHFPLPNREKVIAKEELIQEHQELLTLDLELPVYLFVGAYERKGLAKAISLLMEKPGAQFIIIGKPEKGNSFQFDDSLKIFKIAFTTHIQKFYELSDVFIFPTIYEPYGLVIAEAAAMGNIVYVPKNNVGASEILKGLKSVRFLEDIQELPFLKAPLSKDERILNAQEVRQRLEDYSWEKASKKFLSFTYSS
tara:strand:+ start:8823 stop:9929 length:1107 start_codon:yes stop_codon:yes gene_type:complete